MTDSKIDQLLDQYSAGENRYAIGPFSSGGVTLWKQQVRALNLVYALAESGKIRNERAEEHNGGPPRKVAVIGGGVAGMTAAVAAADLDNFVWHFEQRPILCHLQAGCDTRWVHPNIYDWPLDRSENPYAALPYLNWQAGTAAEVARSLVDGYENIRQERGRRRFHLHLGATTFLQGTNVKWDNSAGRPRGGEQDFDVVILATGFGVERGVRQGDVSSYWRNDSLNQLRPGITSEKSDLILISGTGDGGLIDLLRCKLAGFNQAWIIDDLFTEDDDPLLAALREIPQQWAEHSKHANGWLFDRFATLPGKPVSRVMKKLIAMIRKDIVVILNGQPNVFREVLNLDNASLFNSFLVYLLYKHGDFTYVPGGCTNEVGNEVVIVPPFHEIGQGSEIGDRSSKYAVDQVIIRHGTDRKQCLNSLGLTRAEITALQDKQEVRQRIPTFEPYWTKDGWFAQKAPVGRKEFLPSPTQAIAATFVSTLSRALAESSDDPTDFRLTLHRVIRIHDDEFFQQTAPYGGTRQGMDARRDAARVIPLDVGLVGYACRKGRPVVLVKAENWEAIWDTLNATDDKHVRTYPDDIEALLAFPIFSDCDDACRVSLIVYLDSRDPTFLDQTQTAGKLRLATIYQAAGGFVQNCDDLRKRRIIGFARDSYRGVAESEGPNDDQLTNYDDLKFVDDGIGIADYSRDSITSSMCLHWDCIYRNYDLLPQS